MSKSICILVLEGKESYTEIYNDKTGEITTLLKKTSSIKYIKLYV